MADDMLLEPLKGYKSFYKTAIKEEAGRFFDELVVKAEIDVDANRKTIKEKKKKEDEANKINKKLSGLKTGRVFSIIGIVVCLIVSIVCFYLAAIEPHDNIIKIFIGVLTILIAIGLLVLILAYLNPSIRDTSNTLNALNAKIKELSDLAFSQMARLNALYDYNIPTTIIEKIIPTLDFDKYFDAKKYLNLVKNYGFADNNDENNSILFVQSGKILGNPFLIQEGRNHQIVDKVYTGTRVITWTERRRDSNGKSYTVTRTQTLTATSTHPAPSYTKDVKLIYGNDAAPDLSFSRFPSNMSGKSEKEYDKYVRNNEDDLRKKAEASIKRGDKNPFTPLANSEFELLFGAYDRNHNVQYRLLFTPLAQVNMTNLIKTNDGFGDDFIFRKEKKINTIKSTHSQSADYSGDPSIYISNDHDWARLNFIGYISYYFKNIYFDFAPLLSIPLYQQMKSIDYIYGEDTPSNYSYYEHEAFANSFNDSVFKDEKSITQAILKTRFIKKDGLTDQVEVTASSYRGEDRVDIVPVLGGDGKLHNVPVKWIEYFPLVKKTMMSVRDINSTRFDFNNKMNDNRFKEFINKNSINSNYCFHKGMIAYLGNCGFEKELDSIFKKD